MARTPLLLTGFGPFGSIAENPSQELVLGSGLPSRVLEVAYAEVDRFLDEIRTEPPLTLLCLGVAAGTPRMRLETVGRNWIGIAPDARDEVWGPGPIDSHAPFQLASPLAQEAVAWALEAIDFSTDAGDYLCNYLLFRAIQALPDCRVGFLHIPTFRDLPMPTQAEALRGLVDALDRNPARVLQSSLAE